MRSRENMQGDGEDRAFMKRALRLARRGGGWTSPNPLVGAVIVRNSAVIGEGWHRRFGGPHAEREAVEDAVRRGISDLRGATLYVTLEPCSHWGKTPPCADLVAESGIVRVVCGMIDPNPLVSGKGLERLRMAGIAVETGLLESECRELNRPFLTRIATGRPHILLKTALSLDGKTAAPSGQSRGISCGDSLRETHMLRSRLAAVAVGVRTVLADNPELTVRLKGGPWHQPVRIIVDSALRTPCGARLFHDISRSPLWIAASERGMEGAGASQRRADLARAGAEVIVVPGAGPRVDLTALAEELGRRGIDGVLLEGGATLGAAALEAGIVDRIRYCYAPILIGGETSCGALAGDGRGGLDAAWAVKDPRIRRCGRDLIIEGDVDYTGRQTCSPA